MPESEIAWSVRRRILRLRILKTCVPRTIRRGARRYRFHLQADFRLRIERER